MRSTAKSGNAATVRALIPPGGNAELQESGGYRWLEEGRFTRIELKNLLVEGVFAGCVARDGPVTGGITNKPG
jgi:hypothetical protein